MNDLLKPIPKDIIHSLSKKELVVLLEGEQSLRLQMQEKLDFLTKEKNKIEEQKLEIEGKYVKLKRIIFSGGCEKTIEKAAEKNKKKSKSKKGRKKTVKKLTERYPNLPIEEQHLSLAETESCKCCNSNMSSSGMFEVSEYLDVTPKRYKIVRQLREKYRCKSCYSSIVTTPAPPRIKPGSSYSDEMILDVALSKYCDLIPIDRYAAMATRQGVGGLAPNSLIGTTHYLASFLKIVYSLIKKEVQSLRVVSADETPHKMLEGDEKKNWYLWGFSNKYSCYFECHDTRAGKIATDILLDSKSHILLTDVYSGYIKAAKDVNKIRKERELQKLIAAYCNAHCRRKFKDAENKFPKEVEYYLNQYQKIYRLEKSCKGLSPRKVLKIRNKMNRLFKRMKKKAQKEKIKYSTKSDMATALNYLIENFTGLTVFLRFSDVPIDNNRQERLLRSPVVGRKTWLGTHSKKGAETAAILFSIVESCKLNRVNPREFFKKIVADIHNGKKPYTPKEYREKTATSIPPPKLKFA